MRFLNVNINLLAGGAIVLSIVAVAGVSLFYTPHDPNRMDLGQCFQPPGLIHLLGTDQYGRDILSRLMEGACNSLVVGVVAVGIGLTLGVLLGSLAAYWRDWKDEGIMRLVDALYGFPAVLSAILFTSMFGPGIVNSMIAIGLFNIPIFARLTRGVSLSVWQRDFVTSARAVGQSNLAIIWHTILPNIISPLIVQATVQLAIAILAEAALSYLGLGTQPPQASWGRMLSEAQTFMEIYPWLAIFPGLTIALAVLGFNLLGDGLRDLLDPKWRKTGRI